MSSCLQHVTNVFYCILMCLVYLFLPCASLYLAVLCLPYFQLSVLTSSILFLPCALLYLARLNLFFTIYSLFYKLASAISTMVLALNSCSQFVDVHCIYSHIYIVIVLYSHSSSNTGHQAFSGELNHELLNSCTTACVIRLLTPFPCS